MNIFKRSLQIKNDLVEGKINTLDRPLATRDIVLNQAFFIKFIVGYEVYYYVYKDSTGIADIILDTESVLQVLVDKQRACAIELEALKANQFKREVATINKFIVKNGGKHV